ncbi:hypothetical protein OUZ56_002475 [Daphnia magna]|uniref:Uncharacterized protein n=1 Tax=Daphnia magna TaxID=35525 RepID=A0ABR0A5T5_9CRUS|nr:hypothetical protein OUZ56_002475 [Daphnia magna]
MENFQSRKIYKSKLQNPNPKKWSIGRMSDWNAGDPSSILGSYRSFIGERLITYLNGSSMGIRTAITRASSYYHSNSSGDAFRTELRCTSSTFKA